MTTILVVDDDQDFVSMSRMVLERSGYTVVCASSPSEGKPMIDRYRPSLLLLDVMMESPDDGIVMAQALRREGNKIPILMLTSPPKVTGMGLASASRLDASPLILCGFIASCTRRALPCNSFGSSIARPALKPSLPAAAGLVLAVGLVGEGAARGGRSSAGAGGVATSDQRAAGGLVKLTAGARDGSPADGACTRRAAAARGPPSAASLARARAHRGECGATVHRGDA